MADESDDRMKKFEAALKDPLPAEVTKFAPKRITDEPPSPPLPAPLSALVAMLRAHGKGILDLADQCEKHIDGSEESMRKAIDNLMDTIKRVK